MNQQTNFDYEQYKLLATQDDVRRIRQIYRPKLWENLPILGALIYLIRMSIEMAGIDRGPLRRQIAKYRILAILIGFGYFAFFFFMLTPWTMFLVFYAAIHKTEALIQTKQI